MFFSLTSELTALTSSLLDTPGFNVFRLPLKRKVDFIQTDYPSLSLIPPIHDFLIPSSVLKLFTYTNELKINIYEDLLSDLNSTDSVATDITLYKLSYMSSIIAHS